MYSLELPHQGSSDEHIQYTIILLMVEKTAMYILNYTCTHLPLEVAL